MTERYVSNFQIKLLEISKQSTSGIEQIESMANVYVDVVKQNKFCMCGMLASELTSICEASVAKLIYFFDIIQLWIQEAITLGQNQKIIKNIVSAKDSAIAFVSVREGAMLVARAKDKLSHLVNVIHNTIEALKI